MNFSKEIEHNLFFIEYLDQYFRFQNGLKYTTFSQFNQLCATNGLRDSNIFQLKSGYPVWT